MIRNHQKCREENVAHSKEKKKQLQKNNPAVAQMFNKSVKEDITNMFNKLLTSEQLGSFSQ